MVVNKVFFYYYYYINLHWVIINVHSVCGGERGGGSPSCPGASRNAPDPSISHPSKEHACITLGSWLYPPPTTFLSHSLFERHISASRFFSLSRNQNGNYTWRFSFLFAGLSAARRREFPPTGPAYKTHGRAASEQVSPQSDRADSPPSAHRDDDLKVL